MNKFYKNFKIFFYLIIFLNFTNIAAMEDQAVDQESQDQQKNQNSMEKEQEEFTYLNNDNLDDRNSNNENSWLTETLLLINSKYPEEPNSPIFRNKNKIEQQENNILKEKIFKNFLKKINLKTIKMILKHIKFDIREDRFNLKNFYYIRRSIVDIANIASKNNKIIRIYKNFRFEFIDPFNYYLPATADLERFCSDYWP
ncbi:MAG: hypothetical protein WC436_01860 [Candidatus Babeliales bacterium]